MIGCVDKKYLIFISLVSGNRFHSIGALKFKIGKHMSNSTKNRILKNNFRKKVFFFTFIYLLFFFTFIISVIEFDFVSSSLEKSQHKVEEKASTFFTVYAINTGYSV